jgi:hypothetical protein
VPVKLQVMGKSKKGGKSPLGEKIAILTKERGFAKPADFATDNGINIGTFNDLIYGKTKIMPDSLIIVAEKLGVEPWELLRPLVPKEAYYESNERRGDKPNAAPKETKREKDIGEYKSRNDADPGEHTLSSEIAAQVITALEPRLIPLNLSKEKRDLIAEIITMNDNRARAILGGLQSPGLDDDESSAALKRKG